MLTIIQSNKIETLFDELLTLYKQPSTTSSVFEPFNVIVPSKVMGEWLKKQVADQAGISTLVTTEFWGRYYWGLMQRVLRIYKRYREDVLDVPDVALLSKSIMQWQIFGLIMASQDTIVKDAKHPLHEFVTPLALDYQNLSEHSQYQSFSPSNSSSLISFGPTNTDEQINTRQTWLSNTSMLGSQALAEAAQTQSLEERFWQLSGDMASMLNRYMNYRPEWLAAWGKNQAIDVAQMIADKDALQNRLHGRSFDSQNSVNTPDWLIDHYTQLEIAQRYLWKTLFDYDYQYRETLQQQFWHAFTDEDKQIANRCKRQLPPVVILFTVQQLPPNELLDLQRMGELTDVRLLHFNPSEQFWADIVDKNWLLEQQVENPNSIYLKDYGHTLLSRFGKQSREVFAMLANLSGNAYKTVMWQDRFIDNPKPDTLLAHLQQDILMLEESHQTRQKISQLLDFTNNEKKEVDKSQFLDENLFQRLTRSNNSPKNNPAMQNLLEKLEQEYQIQQRHPRIWQSEQLIDTSLSIQVCHSTARQLEVLRTMLIGWLNFTDKPHYSELDKQENPRTLSDILVLLPDIDAQQNTIESIFPKGIGADGYELPARVTGVVGKDINQLWQAISGYYRLLNRSNARFSRVEVFDWLMLPPLYQSFGLNLEQMSRGCELLEAAGYVRGFDEAHLQQTLHSGDDDYRYSFAYALERLVAGVLMPKAEAAKFGELTNQYGEIEYIKPLAQVGMNDAPIVAVLCQIFQTLHDNRYLSLQSQTVEQWLKQIELLIQQRFVVFNQTNAWLAIFAAQNELKNHLQAHQKQTNKLNETVSLNINTDALPLKLNFILESIAQQLVSQQVSAEPSGVITFARIGAVRNLPYKLVVMLNLNLSDFPKRENQNRYNLMQAGLPKRGDRFREDDDLGAFLDGLLCAQQACWLFYNGQSNTDTHEHLPASPVQELLSFLQTEIHWETPKDFDSNGLTNGLIDEKNQLEPRNVIEQNEQNIGQQIEQYLVTHHAALPFDKHYFELKVSDEEDNDNPNEAQSKRDNQDSATDDELSYEQQLVLAKSQLYPPAQIWHGLYKQLSDNQRQEENTNKLEKIEIWQQADLHLWLTTWQARQKSMFELQTNITFKQFLDNEISSSKQSYYNLQQIIRDLQNPTRPFISHQQLYINTNQEELIELEPLIADSLSNYQLLAKIAEQKLTTNQPPQDFNETYLYTENLPAGVNRYQTYQKIVQNVETGINEFFEKLCALANKNFTFTNEQSNVNPNVFSELVAQLHLLIQPTRDDDKKFAKNSELNIDNITSQQRQVIVSELLTPYQEQLVPIVLPHTDNERANSTQNQFETIVLTAEIPNATDLDANKENPEYWLRYLPTSGDEKYQVQFWLTNLCWQIARQTTKHQAKLNDGFSLWQFKKHLWYLPAIEWEQAYQWLQDWLSVWQLSQSQVIILPPKIVFNYLTPEKPKKDALPSTEPSRNLNEWLNVPYGYSASENNFDHPNWQLLLTDKKPKIIEPFITTLGDYLYHPLMLTMQEINKP